MAQFSAGGRQANVPVVPVGSGGGQFEIVAARCKVCQSPHRREIDAALATGMAQSTVKEFFNTAYGSDFFTANNISLHARKHMSIRDQGVRRIYEEAARREGMDIAVVEGFIRTRRAAIDQVINEALTLMQAGTINPEVKDLLAAIQMLEKMDAEQQDSMVAELERQFRAFMAAVKDTVPEDMWGAIYKAYEDKTGIPEQAEIESVIEGEVVEEDED